MSRPSGLQNRIVVHLLEYEMSGRVHTSQTGDYGCRTGSEQLPTADGVLVAEASNLGRQA